MDQEKIDSSKWVERYGDQMYRFTLVRVRDADAAEDIVQSALISGIQSQDSFAGRSSEKSWLFGILKHKIMDHFREIKKTGAFAPLPEDAAEPADYHPEGHWKNPPKNWRVDPEKAAENQQLSDALAHCIDKLPNRFRRIFVLKEVDGLESEAICNEFNIQPTNLWVILHRARNQLRLCLETRWLDK